MGYEVVKAKVKREKIAACMTCPLCNKLFRDATTISECLHTFCRKCIYDKISDEELERCPTCNINLGSVPLEKLRPDHNMQDVRAKIFPFKRRKVEAPEVVSSMMLPTRRKERSLSSLVVNSPKISSKATMTGKRTKPPARKASLIEGSGNNKEKQIKREEDSGDDHPESSSSLVTLKRLSQNVKQVPSSAQPGLPKLNPDKKTSNETKGWELDLWKPLNCLVEVASRSKSFKTNSHGVDSKRVIVNETQQLKPKTKGNKFKTKVDVENNDTGTAPSETLKPKRLRKVHPKKDASTVVSGISPQDLLDATDAKNQRKSLPIWFSLVASEDQEGDAPLPQIPASYIRIRDGNLTVSCIQKYLMRKLNLASETEIEIKCMGQTVLPTLQLYNLVELWLQTAATPQRVPAIIGSSAKDFIMVLAYARKRSH